MPKARRIPSYRYHKASDQAVVVLDGRSHYLGPWDSPESRSRYDRALAEWLAGGRRDRDPAPPSVPEPRPSVSELILAYWRHAEGHYRGPDGTPTEELGNIKAALRHLRALYGPTPAADFGPLALHAVRDRMVLGGLARSTVNGWVNRIRRMFRWAASVEMVPAAVVQALDTLAGLQKGRSGAREPEPIGPVALADVEAVLPLLPRPVAAMVRVQLLTGMRPGEACQMRGRDIAREGGAWVYRPASHKTAWRGMGRAIPLGPRAMEVIEAFAGADPDAYLFDPRAAVAEHHAERSSLRKSRPTPSETARRRPEPGSGHATCYSRASYLNAIVRACDRAFPHPTIRKARGKPLGDVEKAELLAWRKAHRWHPNQLRHAAATAVRAKYGLEAAQVVLGHSRADVTQVYAERDLAKAADVMREIG